MRFIRNEKMIIIIVMMPYHHYQFRNRSSLADWIDKAYVVLFYIGNSRMYYFPA